MGMIEEMVHRYVKYNNGRDECTCGETFSSFGDWAKHADLTFGKQLPALASGMFGDNDFNGSIINTPVKGQQDFLAHARHPNSARFHAILHELGALHDKKQADYGRGDDPFANVRSTEAFGVKPWVGAMIRLNDKIVRLQSLISNGKLANESAEDSLRDIAVYAVIALVLYEQQNCQGQQAAQVNR